MYCSLTSDLSLVWAGLKINRVNPGEKSRRKKKVMRRSMTVDVATGRLNSMSFVKQIGTGFGDLRRSILANSLLEIIETKDDEGLVKKVTTMKRSNFSNSLFYLTMDKDCEDLVEAVEHEAPSIQ